MNIKYKENKEIEIDKLVSLYSAVKWESYSNHPNLLNKIIKNSLFSISAWDETNLIGLIRVVGDDLSIIYIQDLLVLPEYQRKGIGKELLNKILIKYKHIKQIVLITDKNDKANYFYKSLGMKLADEIGINAYLKFK
ncbi:MAG: GNAT family N-acetyltransferase [Candidatus Izemoplasmatales bacterium]